MLKKFAVDEVDSHSKEGAYIIGLSMQGARWDPNSVSIEKSKARNGLEMFPLGQIVPLSRIVLPSLGIGSVVPSQGITLSRERKEPGPIYTVRRSTGQIRPGGESIF